MRIGILGSAAGLAVLMVMGACGPSRPGEQDAGFDAGPQCGVGGCVQHGDSGTDGGTGDGGTGDGGTDAGTWDGGIADGGAWTVTVEDLRGNSVPFGTRVVLADVVVGDVFNKFQGGQGDWLGEFWVVDPASPQRGLWVRKRYQDLPKTYEVQRGDKITLNGWFGTESQFFDRSGFRRVIKAQNDFLPAAERPGLEMEITYHAGVSPPADLVVQAVTFGNAENGAVRANLENAGARVHVQGPLELVEHSPAPLERIHNGVPDGYNGFELTGGILVNNFKTFRADGGCPWRDVARDAGTQGGKVVFVGGVKGTWESYTHAPCTDGGSVNNCFPRAPGHIPGTDAGWTMVLYPDGCEDFVGGEVQ